MTLQVIFPGRTFSVRGLPISPSMALALSVPTFGYYTFTTFASYLGVEGNLPTIATRAVGLVITGAAFVAGWRYRTYLPKRTIPGFLFLLIYLWRLAENVLVQGLTIKQGNGKAFLVLFFGSLVTSLMLTCLWRGFSTRDSRIILSCLAVFFAIIAVLSVEGFGFGFYTGRLEFLKVGPIPLAYACSSFMLYYLFAARKNRWTAMEAMVVLPILVFIAVQAQSRGMMLASAVCLLIYFAALRGVSRLMLLVMVCLFAAMSALFIDLQYLDLVIKALYRIDTVNDASTATRVYYIRAAFDQFLADPLFGRYVTERYFNSYPHNIYLESLMAVGLVGSLPFVLHFVFASYAAFRILRLNSDNWTWTLIALLFFRDAVGSAASGSIWSQHGFWITSFLVIAIWQGYRRDSKRLRSARERSDGVILA